MSAMLEITALLSQLISVNHHRYHLGKTLFSPTKCKARFDDILQNFEIENQSSLKRSHLSHLKIFQI